MIKKSIRAFALALAVMTVAVMPAMAYEVKQGDTLGEIAKAHDMTLWELSTLNPQVADLDLIYVGDIINTEQRAIVQPKKPDSSPDPPIQYEKELLAQLVYAEARGESFIGKVAVAEVVLNRLNSPNFPNTIEGVIYQPKQFVPAYTGSLYNTPDADSVRAVELALTGTNYTYGALYFYNAQSATNRWLDGLPTITKIGAHTFK